ncbi:unnamed protein product [Pieris macdunnoughi]|uniref:Uncharacterized protein n=1 Tax=Pieris macdunnoughi TaxID=345717 RepID=A0A821UG01_9NEOP|nr:unnamed protein product [Pieris macdunnoughi]
MAQLCESPKTLSERIFKLQSNTKKTSKSRYTNKKLPICLARDAIRALEGCLSDLELSSDDEGPVGPASEQEL